MTLIYQDKHGKPLKGAALNSAILSEARNAYFSRHPEQLAALKNASPEDSAIIERSAIDAGTRILGKSQRRGVTIQQFATILGASCTAGLLMLMARPDYFCQAFFLGAGLGTSISISRAES
ncbi:hypothetical protein IQ235_03975 [Oscillatoriales cyanobacterium LEGE 11467]|uniref:Uncharacterized protein n=1 Tax=Zarconia navalis LEGE 11467 TaxID=1828826 RepID=A0A928VY78_9CYAN|nr:hypothetical protein [Zarconia navalis]MBE9039950.1 hypothetical protein [Zarconia navalis LEGE 11467]